jgi:hypothetical protein
MAHTTPLPLAQQVLAWALQAMGRANDLVEVSPGTRKNAQRGAPIPQRWDGLIEEWFRALGAEPSSQQREAVHAWLRAYDQRIATLIACELSVADRLPAVLDVVVPPLGCWLGAVMACFDEGLLNDQVSAKVPDLTTWLSEPLSPLVFTRMFQALVLVHAPAGSREQRREMLESVLSPNTFDRWWDGGVEVPTAEVIKRLPEVIGGGSTTEFLLRVARLLQVLRLDLVTWYGSEEDVAAIAKTAQVWARAARTVLREPPGEGWRRDLIQLAIAGLEGAEGASVAATLQLGRDGVASPADLATRLRGVLSGEGPDADRERVAAAAWVSLWGVGGRILKVAAGYELGIGSAPAALLSDPISNIQADWYATAILRGAADHLVPDLPDDVRAAAAAYLSERRALVATRAGVGRKAEIPGLVQRIIGVHADIVSQADVDARLTLPAHLEAGLPDDVVAAHPHLGAQRVHRLMHEGRVSDGLSWYGRMIRARALKLQPDREVVAKALIEGAHRLLDDAREAGTAPGTAGDVDDERWARFLAAQNQASTLFTAASKLMSLLPTGVEYADELVHLLPLAIRLDLLTEEDTWPRSEPLAAHLLERDTKRHPTHGGLWAVAAVWSHLNELGDSALSERHAGHFGSKSLLDSIWQRLRRDAEFCPRVTGVGTARVGDLVPVGDPDRPRITRGRTPGSAMRLCQSQCVGRNGAPKRRYFTEGEALENANHRRGLGAPPLRVYYCPSCGGYHLTST